MNFKNNFIQFNSIYKTCNITFKAKFLSPIAAVSKAQNKEINALSKPIMHIAHTQTDSYLNIFPARNLIKYVTNSYILCHS